MTFREQELEKALTGKVFRDLDVEMPGPIYESLCHAFPLRQINTKKFHRQALEVLTRTSEFLGANKISPLLKRQIVEYMDALGLLVEAYEKRTADRSLRMPSGRDVLEFLMQEHGLRQQDLRHVLGEQSVVSEILSGKRRINAKQIQALAKRFGVSPSVFFPA